MRCPYASVRWSQRPWRQGLGALLLMVLLAGCGQSPQEWLVGTWRIAVSDRHAAVQTQYILRADGTGLRHDGTAFTWRVVPLDEPILMLHSVAYNEIWRIELTGGTAPRWIPLTATRSARGTMIHTP